jgi:heme exporter protein C
LFTTIRKYAAPVKFYPLAGALIPWLGGITIVLLGVGLYLGIFVAPTDYQQGESYRIMYIHVPAAWMSMFTYMIMAGAGLGTLVWKTKVSEMVASASAPLGASFTAMALISGSLWGKPMWGTYWAWDARMTSELILLFLYLGYMALEASIEDPRKAARATAVLALVGVVNIPIIHFSVQWWNTLHQPASISSLNKIERPSIDPSMLKPLLIMAIAFHTWYLTMLLVRIRNQILVRERNTEWMKTMLGEKR